MSIASTGRPFASVIVWSAAQVLTSRLSRGDQVSSTQPEPPPNAYPTAMNSAFQRATLPKSFVSCSASAPFGSPSPPRQSK